MGNVIKFPLSKKSNSIKQSVYKETATQIEKDLAETFVISPQEDEAFVDLILEWPCYNGFCKDITLPQLFEKYYGDELSLSQDCALEFMFHMHDPESSFDIANALYTWELEDREFFILSLNMHAELIDKVKQEEF